MAKSGGGKSRRSGGSEPIVYSTQTDVLDAGLVRGKDLTKEERIGLEAYQVYNYRDINSHLRGGPSNVDAIAHIGAIDSAMEFSITEIPLTTRRGIIARDARTKDIVRDLKPGKTFTQESYVSTTIDKRISDKFGGDKNTSSANPGDQTVELTIRIPRGTKAIYMPRIFPESISADEREVLLARGLRYRVVSRIDDGNHASIVVEVIP